MRDSTKYDIIGQDWHQKSGGLPFPMTNDYLFRALCQKDSLALRSLICSVLRWDESQVVSAEVTNPILLGKAIEDKEFILDVNVLLGNDVALNLEMQVISYDDWPERSLQYLCRQFDQLRRGEDYGESKTAVHIGILSFDPFGGRSMLRESYRIWSMPSQLLYTDKFQIYTLCLPQAQRVDQEDRKYHTDAWAAFFRAKTWEDLKMAAAKDTGIASAVTTANKFWEDQDLRARMEAREDYYRRVRTEQAKMCRLQEALAEAEKKITEAEINKAETERKMAETEEMYRQERRERQKLQEELEHLRRQLEDKRQTE